MRRAEKHGTLWSAVAEQVSSANLRRHRFRIVRGRAGHAPLTHRPPPAPVHPKAVSALVPRSATALQTHAPCICFFAPKREISFVAMNRRPRIALVILALFWLGFAGYVWLTAPQLPE